MFRKGICNELNLNCFSFLQPFATIHGNYFKQPIKSAIELRVLNIKENIKIKKRYNILKNVTNIIDITNSLDESKNLSYIDAVHYSPSANEAIASKIYNIIEDKLNEQ